MPSPPELPPVLRLLRNLRLGLWEILLILGIAVAIADKIGFKLHL